ncbi:MAG: hypothetical protein DHS20C01_19310 [marine bacterium B5-7]|nr:MAG: hypothetical protein DHS20C01_19310 [marine bacterium B5-7]
MPYFVFQINNHREYHCLGHHDDYREARGQVRLQRLDESSDIIEYKMVFANDEEHAEVLLRTRRERIPSEDD